MKGIAKRITSAVVAAAAALVLAISAFADYTYSFDDKILIPELTGTVIEMDGTTVVLEKELGEGKSDDGITIRFALFNDYLNTEFWNTDDIAVSCEVKLETEGADVIAFIPGFDTTWTWVNPSQFTQLKYGEWITISETGKHFYPTFSKSAPNQLLFQLRSNWDAGKQGLVRITLRNFTIHGTPVPIETTTVATTTATAETTTAATTTVTTTTAKETEPEITQSEPEVTDTEPIESEPEETTATEKADEPEETTATTTVSETTTASIQTAAAATTATSIDYSALLERPENNIGLMIGIILGVAALVVAGVVVGYIIYRKKKYY